MTSEYTGHPDAPTTQRALLTWGSERLATLNGDEGGATPQSEARALLAWVLDVDSLFHAPKEVNALQAQRYREAVEQRRAHTPLEHITGQMHFRGMTLVSRPGAFIVRPETEIVVERALQEFHRTFPTTTPTVHTPEPETPLVVDLCTGSGAIALACAREIPRARVYAVELSPEAASVARDNLTRYGEGRVRLVEADATAPATLADLNGTVHLLVTNPPYVPEDEAPTQQEAQRDPDLALYGGGEDGTLIPIALIRRAADLLAPGGILVMEHSPSQSTHLRGAAREAGFVHVETGEDWAGKERMLIARKGL